MLRDRSNCRVSCDVGRSCRSPRTILTARLKAKAIRYRSMSPLVREHTGNNSQVVPLIGSYWSTCSSSQSDGVLNAIAKPFGMMPTQSSAGGRSHRRIRRRETARKSSRKPQRVLLLRNSRRASSLLNAGNRDIFQKNREAIAQGRAITMKD
jgi:hypothetical protein